MSAKVTLWHCKDGGLQNYPSSTRGSETDLPGSKVSPIATVRTWDNLTNKKASPPRSPGWDTYQPCVNPQKIESGAFKRYSRWMLFLRIRRHVWQQKLGTPAGASRHS